MVVRRHRDMGCRDVVAWGYGVQGCRAWPDPPPAIFTLKIVIAMYAKTVEQLQWRHESKHG
jgi:hypothetical protein